MTDNAGNVTAGELSELSLRVGGRALRGGAASVSYSRSAAFSGRLATRDGVAVARAAGRGRADVARRGLLPHRRGAR